MLLDAGDSDDSPLKPKPKRPQTADERKNAWALSMKTPEERAKAAAEKVAGGHASRVVFIARNVTR